MNKSVRKYIITFVLLVLLVAVRYFDKQLFNDGLIDFFKHDYLSKALPKVSIWHIVFIDSLRYWINALLSVFLLKLYFNQANLNRFLWIVYTFVFVLSILILFFLLKTYQPGAYLPLFYVRRFLIQPLLLFLLFPALYYQGQMAKVSKY